MTEQIFYSYEFPLTSPTWKIFNIFWYGIFSSLNIPRFKEIDVITDS